ncbi:hypothetical protein DL96DRAFT_1250774 [Flagelloscypha sp. PMI_526]|nr:hypothetical protein DL96DRAFT_1250774 [Flagelloscypha sp. PMI_526]
MAYSPSRDVTAVNLSTPGNGNHHEPTDSELIQTYFEEGYEWGYGIPLWDPQAIAKVVEVGDVGILTEDGGFQTLFNATVPEHKQNQYRLPPNFSPLKLAEGDLELRRTSISRQFLSHGKMSNSPPDNHPQFTCGEFKLDFQMSHGAILILKDSPTKIATPRSSHIRKYIEQNIESWYTFCDEGLGRDLDRQALIFVTEIRRGFDWALAAWPDVGVEKSISYVGESNTSTNNRKVVTGSWIPSHFAFKDLTDESDCLYNALYPQMDEQIGKHCIFIKGYRLGFRPLYTLPIQIAVPTVSEPPKLSWRRLLKQVIPSALEASRKYIPGVGNLSPPPPNHSASVQQDSNVVPAAFLTNIGRGTPVCHN